MKVKAKIIGLSQPIPGFEGPKEIPVEFAGISLMGLLLHISSGMDSEVRELFLDDFGGISADQQGDHQRNRGNGSNRGNLRLKEGDLVEMVSSPG